MFCGGGTFSKYYPLSPPWYPYFCPETVYTGGKIRHGEVMTDEDMEPEEQIELAIARLSRMGLPITSVEQGIVTIDFNLACLAEH
jgi:hypothetical protein